MTEFDLKLRTRKFAVLVFKFAEKMPRTIGNDIIVKQLLRSSSSVAANYRSVNRAKSQADFINKLIIVQEEADETLFWLEFICDLEIIKNKNELTILANECEQLLSIITKSIITSKNKRNTNK
ncbi:MAG: four helix bundle protein [Bacteroidales bacterium]|jgi:four helix bundle protein|nr:four helix bundle protein [Bacteroidales bacterium]MDD4213738.1 four helix bundle protein [Bacteroidales bacterium]